MIMTNVTRYGSEDRYQKRSWVRYMIDDTTPCSVENTEEGMDTRDRSNIRNMMELLRAFQSVMK